MTKNDIKDFLGNFGCLGIILITLAAILIAFPAILFLGGVLWGCVVYAVWNWVVVPVAGVPVLTFWWQCFICGVAILLVLSAIKTVRKAS